MKLVIDTDTWKARLLSRFTLPDDFFPPETSLLKLPVVVWTFWVLILITIATASTVIWTSWPLHADFSAKGYEEAASLIKAPITVFFLLIPVLALFASNHRSVQTMRQMSLTTKQIELTSSQNLFANYYKHIEEFSKWCDNIDQIGAPKSTRKLHKILFPRAREGDLHLSSTVLADVDDYTSAFLKALRQLEKDHDLYILFQIYNRTKIFAEKYLLTPPPGESEGYGRITVQRVVIPLPGNSVRQFLRQQIIFVRALENLLIFDENFVVSRELNLLVGLDLEAVPESPDQAMAIMFPNLPKG